MTVDLTYPHFESAPVGTRYWFADFESGVHLQEGPTTGLLAGAVYKAREHGHDSHRVPARVDYGEGEPGRAPTSVPHYNDELTNTGQP